MKYTIAQALKARKRLVERISIISVVIQTKNSQSSLAEREEDVKALLIERTKLVNDLVELKTAVSAANLPIQGKLYKQAELKGSLSFLRGIETFHGPQRDPYSRLETPPTLMVAEFRKAEIDKLIDQDQKDLDKLQEEIDYFNYTTSISVGD